MAKPATVDVPARTKKAKGPDNVSGGRESVETFVTVFLAFLVLGVVAEPFVIPTGSMAPTLLGRNKEVTCPECGLVYNVDGNREVEGPGAADGSVRITGSVCVNCRALARIGDQPNFQGDRIYVIKTPLYLPFVTGLGTASLGRWDVAVFKLPEEPEVRYIKRMVGMPDETVRVQRGDIWVRPAKDEGPFHRPLRPLKHQDAMQILVHDDAFRPRSLRSDPAWARWVAKGAEGWTESTTDSGVYEIKADAPAWSSLRYRHVFPDPVQWDEVLSRRPLSHKPRPTLITDFYAYNTEWTNESETHPLLASKSWRQPHWVGDLTLDLTLEVKEPKGVVRIELVKAGVVNRCEFDLAADQVSLWHGETRLGEPAPARLGKTGKHTIRFSNVDDRLTVRIDGTLPFGEGLTFEPGNAIAPTAADLDPVRVSANGASMGITGLRLSRDIYYTLQPGRVDYESLDPPAPIPPDPVELYDWLADPNNFGHFARIGHRDYPLSAGKYMMFGDNSPWSRDGRDWKRSDQLDPEQPGGGWDTSGRQSWEVPESLLVGKAFCVFWPHLKPVWPAFRIGRDARFPARPYFERMRWVR